MNDSNNSLSMFQSEATGLQELRLSNTIRVPEPIRAGKFESDEAYLLMEYIKLQPPSNTTERKVPSNNLLELNMFIAW